MLPEVRWDFDPQRAVAALWRVVFIGSDDWQAGRGLPDAASERRCTDLREQQLFRAKDGEVLALYGCREGGEHLLLVGLGDAPRARQWRQGAAKAVACLRERQCKQWCFELAPGAAPDCVAWILDGCLLELYRFDHYRHDVEQKLPASVTIHLLSPSLPEDELESMARQRLVIAQGVALARDLVNEPSNVKTPAYLAQQAWDLAAELGLKATILGPAALKEQGFGALLAVAQGSAQPPRLIVLEYGGGEQDEAPLALVGKGVTFDSGGISLKPGENMDQMKMDMAGGAVVLAVLQTAARLKLPVNLIGVVPAVENMPSGQATRPGDIVMALSGRSIEILNTDAEGRLILADALHWAAQKKPRAIIDLATLTGACIIALGHHAAAVLGSDEGLLKVLQEAGERCGERLWPLPLFEDYREQLKSKVADLKNIGGKAAGTITAAAFLSHFVADCPWAHLDIAGTAWEEQGKPGQPAGATGFGVRLLVDYLLEQASR
ncbi:MAG: leucyl aminopeptidase [Desulfuromonadaceae bacterium]|nr:leucyl aminopeptidase [Desulfuromonadaceae bacterium]